MDEVMMKIALGGEEKAKVLNKINDVVESWGLKLPDVDPDVLHFGYNEFGKIGETEFNINNNITEGYCGKFMFMFEGQTCPMHHHKIKHETFYMVKGAIKMNMKNNIFTMNKGDIKIINQNQWHEFTALENSLILECSKPDLVEDSIFEDDFINHLIVGE